MAFRKCNDFKEITLVYASNGPATLQLYTDMPGGALAARLTENAGAGVTLASSGGPGVRITQTVALDGIRGTEFYPKITPGSTTQFELYSGVVYLRPLGVYIDGSLTPGEIWQTVPIAPGAGGGQ
jgi:hypothetical protein